MGTLDGPGPGTAPLLTPAPEVETGQGGQGEYGRGRHPLAHRVSSESHPFPSPPALAPAPLFRKTLLHSAPSHCQPYPGTRRVTATIVAS